jgi:LmbE family N-acetylglucosaminyl deacetylase
VEIGSGRTVCRERKAVMLNVKFARPSGSPFRVLCLGAHSDDIEIGCGGTILRLIDENPDIEVDWVVLAAAGIRRPEAVKSANRFLADAGRRKVVTKSFKDGYFPYNGAAIKDFFEALKKKVSPDLILTHYRHDLHQDHRVVSDLTWNTFRDHLILEYEIVKYDGDLGTPNCFVPLTQSVARRKISSILECFGSQSDRNWFTADAFEAILRLRGVESNAPQKLAEAFYCRKMVL